MFSYDIWNKVIASYFIKNIQYGSRVYLSVDDDVLELLGSGFGEDCDDESWGKNFCTVVRNQVVTDETVMLDTISNFDDAGYPRGIAFLGIMALAANRMAENEEIDQKNYFIRFRQLLDLPNDGQTRPKGLQIRNGEAPEASLWERWNQWLLNQELLPTAQKGAGGPNKYINYPISQSLLRNVDKDRLRKIFGDKQWRTSWDEQTLFTKVANEYQILSKHLKRLIDDRQRYEALSHAIHITYEQWLEEGVLTTQTSRSKTREWSRQLHAGIYRTEDFFGNIEYYLYPKQPRGRSIDSSSVQQKENWYPLKEDRAGWYLPLGEPLPVQEISEERIYLICPSNQIERLILPKRDFWILIPDPDNPESGVYASWGSPKLGEQFILLFKESLFADLQRLRDENLIQWEGDRDNFYKPFGDNADWREVYQCQILSQAWDGVFIQSRELKDALQPTTKLSISLSEGLRVPKMNAWIVDHPPQITIFAFHPSIELQIINIHTSQTILAQSWSTNKPFSFNFPSSGSFIISTSYLGVSTQRLIKLIDWDDIDIVGSSSVGY